MHFTASQPAVHYTHDDHIGIRIEEHPAGSQFPEPTKGPSIQPISNTFRPFLAPQDFPKTIQEMVRRDVPQVWLHITSFSNATLLAVAWPHTLMDAIGQQELLRNWSLVLAGREAEVRPILGARSDILQEVQQPDKEEEALLINRNRLGRLGSFMLVARYIWDKLWNPALEVRAMFLPREALSRLRSRAEQQIQQAGPQTSDQASFVSEGDVLTAWATHAVAVTTASRPLTVISFFNARFRLPQCKSAAGIYAQNMTLLTFTFLSAPLARGSLGLIALSHRRHMAEQTTQQQTSCLLRAVRDELENERGLDWFLGEASAIPILVNNLTKANLIKSAEFGPAVVSRGDDKKTRSNPLGTMVMYYNQPVDTSLKSPSSFYMLGKDFADNYWLMGNLYPRTWLQIDEDLRNM